MGRAVEGVGGEPSMGGLVPCEADVCYAWTGGKRGYGWDVGWEEAMLHLMHQSQQCLHPARAEDMKSGCLLLKGFSEGWATVPFPSCQPAPSVTVTIVMPLASLLLSQGCLTLVRSFWGNGGWTGWFVKPV